MNRLSRTLALGAAVLTVIGAWTGNRAVLAAAIILFALAWITAPSWHRAVRPQVPLDGAYYAQPLWRRVLAGLLGVRARPTDTHTALPAWMRNVDTRDLTPQARQIAGQLRATPGHATRDEEN